MPNETTATETTATTDTAPASNVDAELRELLDLPADDEPVTADDKADDTEADKAEAKPEAKPDDKPAADEDADLKAILARSRKRREAREANRAPAAQPQQQPKPSASVAAAVKDVLTQLGQLATEDEQRADDGKAPTNTDEIATLKKDLADLKAQQADAVAATQVRQTIASQMDAIETDLPTLAKRRDAVDLVHQAALRFYEKHHTAPDVQSIARRIEKHLAPEAPAKKTETPGKSKTVSQHTTQSPPAKRSGTDKMSAADAEADLLSALGD